MQRRRQLRIRLVAATLLLVAAIGSRVGAQGIPADAEWVPGEILFKLRSDASESRVYKLDPASGRTGLAAVDAALARLEATRITPVFKMDVNAERKHAAGLDRILQARYTAAETPLQAAARLASLPEVEWAEPNWIGHGSFTPNDPSWGLQWGLRNRGQAARAAGDSVGTWDCDIDANQAWDVQTGSFSVVLAILDSGIDAGHPEFAGRTQSGWDFVNNDSDPTDDLGHGTACSGIAAARGNNGQGIAGVAWGVRILPVKVLNAANQAPAGSVAAGITYAADFGSKVISMSLGVPANQTLLDAVNYAHGLDVVLVAATGNANASSVEYPAAYANVIGVGALSPCNERKSPTSCDGMNWGSNYGTELDVLAPGVLIDVTDIRGAGGYTAGDYATGFFGTSAATPFVAGIIALMRSQVNWTNDAITSAFLKSCDDLGPAFWDPETGWGRINAYAAIRATTGAVFVGPNPSTQTGEYRTPFRTISAAVNFVQPGTWIIAKPGDYDEATPWTIIKSIHLEAIDGGVTVR